jgi:hypothetical protein
MSYYKLFDKNTLIINRTYRFFYVDKFDILYENKIISSFTKYSNFIYYNNKKIDIRKYIKLTAKNNIYFNIVYEKLKVIGYGKLDLFNDFFLIFYINNKFHYTMNFNYKSKRNIIIYNNQDIPLFKLEKKNKTKYIIEILNNFDIDSKYNILLYIILAHLVFIM